MNGATGAPMDDEEKIDDHDEEMKDSHAVDSDDSSEEPDEDEEEARRVREGFIVDEDEDEPESDGEDERRRRRRKRRKRARAEDEDILEDDDIDLLEENTGRRVDRQRLTRIRRIRSDSPVEPTPSGSHLRPSGDELDDDTLPDRHIEQIWEDDDRQGADLLDDDMDDFIDDDEQDEGMPQEEREERRKEKKRLERERQRALGSRPELTGIDAGAWDEIYDVFGDGTDYDWALDEEDLTVEDEVPKADLKYADVFEPSEIRARMLTDEDDVIRLQDMPERMQLATSTLLPVSNALARTTLSETDLDNAATWITERLSDRHTKDYIRPGGLYRNLLENLTLAVRKVISLLFIDHFEVPYIWTHKRDHLNHFDPDQPSYRVEFLRRADLWKIYDLGRKYQALTDRKKILETSYEKIQETNLYYENKVRDKVDSVEEVADTSTWLGIMYRKQKKDQAEFHFHDDEDAETKKKKLPSRISGYEIAKNSIISRLADGFGLKSTEVVVNYLAADSTTKDYFVEDQDLPPAVYAEAFGDPNQEHLSDPDQLLQQARMLIAYELGKDPLLRKDVRERFKEDGVVSVSPTEKGLTKIDEHHPYNQFKYLKTKPIKLMLESPQFLHILEAEAEHLAVVNIELSATSLHDFEASLISAFSSDGYSDTAKSWNEHRALVVREALEKHLLPAGVKWIREWVREEAQGYLAHRCGESLRERVNVKGHRPVAGERFARVVAASWGKGDPQKDAITLVYLDDEGILRDNIKVDNLDDQKSRDSVLDLISRRDPAAVVVGGMSIHTTKLSAKLKEVLSTNTVNESGFTQTGVPVTYGPDEVARMYQHSPRAEGEFSALSLTARYCVGLARYAQHPLSEYAALGEDLSVVTFDEEYQNLIPKEKLLFALERTLVDVVNEVGVDINRAVTDPYYRHMLPFISGLGPRKAQSVVKKVASLGGNLINRQQFIRGEIMTTRIFENSAGFLRISQNGESRIDKTHATDDADLPDPLDDTRIHPEDYELARKMAADALDLDEEDIQDEHASHVVLQIMQEKDGEKRLHELNLDDFAVAMFTNNGDLKRHTLNAIRDELLHPFADNRPNFREPTAWDVLTMLTSETEKTLRVGLIVSVMITRMKANYVIVRLDSGIEGVINCQYLAEPPPTKPDEIVKRGQTLLGVIIDVKMELEKDNFSFELSSRQSDVAGGDASFRRVAIDHDFYDTNQAERDAEMLQRKKRNEGNQARRIVKHPNFHNFNSSQAEVYLAKQQRGDAIIRPSSKGADHLAVTWKVDEGLYQHIDVVEPNADATQQTVGRQLIIDNGKYEFADLDELIVNHVQALARRVEELMSHEKFKRGTDESIRKELDDYLRARPERSIYCFTLNRKKPGHFNLVFKANKDSPSQTWPVRVAPEAYYFFDAMVPSVPELCDAFKYRYLHQSNLASTGPKTPFGSRTPARMTPGHRTPGYRTPGQLPQKPNYTQQHQPSGINPERQAMIQSSNWGSGSGGGW